MCCINELIARQANQEDGCAGRYWEGCYKSQALLDEKDLAACMAYVDLNPIRTGLSKTSEQFECTSTMARISSDKQPSSQADTADTLGGLLPFVGYPRNEMPKGLPFRLNDDLELIDWTGRAVLDTNEDTFPAISHRYW